MSETVEFVDRQLAALGGPSTGASTTVQLVRQGWGVIQSGWSVNHRPLWLNGKNFFTGLGTHADSVITLAFPPGATRFMGICGVDDTADTRKILNGVIFTISAGGKELWHSATLTAPIDPARFDLNIKDIPSVILAARAVSDGSYAPCDWVDLHVTRGDSSIEELGLRRTFFDGDGAGISFTYNGAASSTFLSSWSKTVEQTPPGRDRSAAWRITRTDPATGPACIVEIKRYQNFPVAEWTLRFKNTGAADTPILENIHSMDVSFPLADDIDQLPPTTPVLLHYNTGDHAAPDGYEPHAAPLQTGAAMQFAPDGGRPTDHAWPYYDLELPTEHHGVIAVVSWPGQWSSTIARGTCGGDDFRITAGQQLTHLRLHPGEEIRAPLSVLMFYHGDYDHGQNLWRRWMIADNVPRPGGQLPPAVHSSSAEDLYQHQQVQTDAIDRYAKQNVGLNYWWLDAGWYPCKDDFWWNLSSWDADPARFPGNIKAVSDDAHAHGMKQILWFEPERAHIDGWLWTHHPEYLLIKKGLPAERLLDLGNPAAWKWLLDTIDGQLTAQHIDVYRQDFNFEPLEFWRQHDAPDRQGITEIRHVQGSAATATTSTAAIATWCQTMR